MEGYSVTEAASVLGVPTERVWELLARGVLAGTPEGEAGMRVFLQPRPAPVAEVPPPTNGGHIDRDQPEASPFRELLTEFRGLTERYGQALLALGEARGEVASLRSRVDLLEARMDLRLPMGGPMPSASYATSPLPPVEERRVMPAAPAPEAPSTEVDAAQSEPTEPSEPPAPSEPSEEEEEHARRRRARGPHDAVENFAEALARAEDPSDPELPGARDAAEALAGLRDSWSEVAGEAALPRELPVAEEVPVAEEDTAAEPAEAPEVATDHEPDAEVEPSSIEPAAAVAPEPIADETDEVAEELEIEPEPEPDAKAEPDAGKAEPGPEDLAEQAEPEPEAATVEADAHTEAEAEPIAAEAEAKPAVEQAGTDAEPMETESPAAPTGTDQRYTASIGDVDWLSEEELFTTDAIADEPVIDSGPPPVAAEPTPAEVDTAEPDAPEPTAAEPALGEPEPEQGDSKPSAVEDEETMLWLGGFPVENRLQPPPEAAPIDPPDAAEEIEVAAHGGGRGQPADPEGTAPGFPGSQELDEALAALDALSRPRDEQESEPAPEPARQQGAPETEDRDSTESEPVADQSNEPVPEEAWPPQRQVVGSRLRRESAPPTVSSASRAYRRLRRIFPG
ncbi:MAG: hypothetical protein ACRDGD_02550 [Candidatus Limnocylindria bacterium]